TEIDLRALEGPELVASIEAIQAREANTHLDLSEGPLLRARLLRLEDDAVLLVAVHHIVFDGWSVGLFLGEIGELYSAFHEGKPSPLAELQVQYADYAHWQRELFRGEVLEAQTAYWRRQLEGVPPLELPTDHPRPEVQTSRGGSERVGLSQELSDKLKETSQREGVTLFMTLLAAYTVLLHHRSGAEDVVVGSPVATHRDREELQGVIGCFLNTLALRVDLSGDPSFRELLRRVRRTVLEGFSNQDLPFDQLVDTLGFRRDVSRTPVFQVLFNHSMPNGRLRFGGLKLSSVELGDPTAKFDLELATEESGGRIVAMMRYNADLFDPATVREILGELETLLLQVAEDPDRTLPELRLELEEQARARRARARSEREEALRQGLHGARRKPITIQT
ncbi:MAG TPA: condensation domain-containing protein, partial [Longimicrobiaceae bacterium]|nr:condensation domain-containing protein [Longimicrobiaceae bacterium]